MLQYAGIDITPDLALTQNWAKLDKWAVREAPDLFSFQGFNAPGLNSLPIPDRPKSQTPIPLNTLIWPSSASRYAQFLTFVGGTQKAAIEAAVGLNSPTPQPLLISDPNQNTSISPLMYLLGFRPAFVQNLSMQLWMMYLVDERFYWWMQNLTYTVGASWTSLLTNLVTATGTSGALTLPSIPSAYGTPSTRWGTSGQPLPPTIDATAATVGLRFIRNLDGTLAFVNAATAQAADATQYSANQPNVAFGGRSTVQDLIGTIPASVNVNFGTAGTENVTLESLALPAFGAITGTPNAAGWIYADATAESSAYANQAASDYYNWLLSLTDCVFRSIQPINPTGIEDRIEWEYVPRLFDPIKDEMIPDDERFDRAWKRIATRIVKRDWADNNQYGSILSTSPPPPPPPTPLRGYAAISADVVIPSGGIDVMGISIPYGHVYLLMGNVSVNSSIAGITFLCEILGPVAFPGNGFMVMDEFSSTNGSKSFCAYLDLTGSSVGGALYAMFVTSYPVGTTGTAQSSISVLGGCWMQYIQIGP